MINLKPIFQFHLQNQINKGIITRKYLFLLCPPYSGSTVLHELISTSKFASFNNNKGTREGQTLSSVKKIMFDSKEKWDPKYEMPWGYIKKEWHKYWNLKKPVLIEKSPPNIIRALQIEKYFENTQFVIMVRNPYAHSESLMRRNNISAESAAITSLQCLQYQRYNIENLKNYLFFSYEDLVERSEIVKKKILNFVPELVDINIYKRMRGENHKNHPIKLSNFNQSSIKRLTKKEIEDMSRIFLAEQEMLSYFNYEIL